MDSKPVKAAHAIVRTVQRTGTGITVASPRGSGTADWLTAIARGAKLHESGARRLSGASKEDERWPRGRSCSAASRFRNCPRRPARVNLEPPGPVAQVFLGSRATKILRHSPVPVVVPRGQANEIAKGMS